MRITGLDHVLLAIPPGPEAEAAARRFWVDVMGLREVPKPPELDQRAGGWFVGPGIAIHVGAERDFRPARKAHPALLVDDLEASRPGLVAAGVTLIEDDSGFAVRRCYVEDPFGNRIELIDGRDAGFTEGWVG